MPLKLKDSSLLKTEAFIGGKWRPAASGKTFDVKNPATGDRLAAVPKMGADESREAIDAAAKAFPEWAGLLAEKRAQILRQWFRKKYSSHHFLWRACTSAPKGTSASRQERWKCCASSVWP